MNGQQLLDALLDIQRRGHPLDRLDVVIIAAIFDNEGQVEHREFSVEEVSEHVNSGEIIVR